MEILDFYSVWDHLTDDQDRDKLVLQDMFLERVKNGADDDSIIPLAQTLYDMSTDSEKLYILDKLSPEMARQIFLMRTSIRMAEERVDERNIIKSLMDNYLDKYGEDEKVKYYIFSDPLDEAVLRLIYDGNKEIKKIPNGEYLTDLAEQYGVLFILSEEFVEAKELLLKFLEYDPYDYGTLEKVYENTDDYDGLISLYKHVLKYASNPMEIAVTYSKLGDIYANHFNNLDLAAANFALSILFSSPASPSGFAFEDIRKQTSLEGIDFIELLKENDIPIGVNPSVISALEHISNGDMRDSEIIKYAKYRLDDFSNIEIPETMDVQFILEEHNIKNDSVFEDMEFFYKMMGDPINKQ